MNIKIDIVKDIPVDKINKFADLVVYDVARGTLDMTEGFFPRLTGDLERSSYAMGVVGSKKTYGLGSMVDYAKYVWDYPQNTHWTNPNTQAQWYLKTFKNRKEHILNQAVTGAKKQV